MDSHHHQFFIADLGYAVDKFLRRSLFGIALLASGIVVQRVLGGGGAAIGLAWISGGTLIAILLWRGKGVGLPLVPLLAIQHFVVYAVPIVSENEVVFAYPTALIDAAGFEIFVFLVTTAIVWRMSVDRIRIGSAWCRALREIEISGRSGLVKLGLLLICLVTAYNISESIGLLATFLANLPAGSYPVIAALTKACSIIGYFLMGLAIGSKPHQAGLKSIFWLTFAINAIISASSLLLSSASTIVAAVVIGLFWGSGRIPWRFLGVIGGILSFLHLGKAEMRARYWQDEGTTNVSFSTLPAFYTEWLDLSLTSLSPAAITGVVSSRREERASMVNRVNNLQNLVYVIDAVEDRKIPILDGATYAIVPSLLIPRFLWPDKPRAHEGQVMLNVHFQRQSLVASLATYIAWGLLPEAYGNFGRFWGAIALGSFLGVFFAWLEKKSAPKPLMSIEGLLSIVLLAGIAISYEMVASVLVTSIFQSILITTASMLPFVERRLITRNDQAPPAPPSSDAGPHDPDPAESL